MPVDVAAGFFCFAAAFAVFFDGFGGLKDGVAEVVDCFVVVEDAEQIVELGYEVGVHVADELLCFVVACHRVGGALQRGLDVVDGRVQLVH